MRTSIKRLRETIREEADHARAVNELFGKRDGFVAALDAIMQDLTAANKKVEQAHGLAPQGPARAIIAGIHSDLFNQIAEFRKHVERLKSMSRAR